ncbi:MAG: hypothetical protein ACMUIU_04010 [bacterium]
MPKPVEPNEGNEYDEKKFSGAIPTWAYVKGLEIKVVKQIRNRRHEKFKKHLYLLIAILFLLRYKIKKQTEKIIKSY